jgi:hypothetical protein
MPAAVASAEACVPASGPAAPAVAATATATAHAGHRITRVGYQKDSQNPSQNE